MNGKAQTLSLGAKVEIGIIRKRVKASVQIQNTCHPKDLIGTIVQDETNPGNRWYPDGRLEAKEA
jgi:hypothetical protein